jgi:PAS domain S-box-containing protein
MIFIWFVYGLAFFALGLVILVYPKKDSRFSLANQIWLIAGFGILHGINEWLDMFIHLGEPFPPGILKIIRIATLVGSFLFLLRFGTKVISKTQQKHRFLKSLPVVLFAIWAIILSLSTQRLLMGDISARYLLCAPGAFLTALALLLQIPQFKETKLDAVIRNLRISAFVFACYAVFAGLIVKRAPFFPASVLNYDLFRDVLGVPVQIFRAFCAVVLAYSTTKILSIFRWETQEALRRSEQRCSTIAAAAPVILLVQDRNSVITFIEGKGLDILGLKAENIIGSCVSEAFPSAPQLDEDSRRALAGEEFGTTVPIDGVIFEFYYSPLRDREGEVTGIIGVALDITAKVKTQTELDRYRREVQKTARLAEVGTMGSVMAQQLDDPLAVTRLLLKRIASDLPDAATSEVVTESLKKGLSEISKAANIVDRFRSVAQVPGKTIIAPVDVYQVAKRVMAVFAQSAKRANLSIAIRDMHFLPFISMTVRELEQVFFILVQNAIDASDINKHQKLTISCSVGDKQIELLFSDTCGGIEPEKLQYLFEPFFTTEPDAKETGLSLAIAKQIVCGHGGEITAESRPSRGTTFHVKLPVEQVR